MSLIISKEIRELLITKLKALPSIKQVSEYYVPNPSKLTKFPTVALDLVDLKRDRATSGNKFNFTEYIDIWVYNRQTTTNKHKDILTDILNDIDDLLVNDEELNALYLDGYIHKLEYDSGQFMPIRGVIATVKLTYRSC